MASEADPENYSIARDVAIIVAVMAVVAGLIGAVGYGAWSLFSTAEKTFAELTAEGPTPEDGADLQRQLQKQLERALGAQPEEKPRAPAKAATIRFELFEAIVARDGTWTIHGDLVNDSPFAVGPPELDFAFLGRSGEIVDTQTVRADLLDLASGESRPFTFQLSSRENTTAVEIIGARAQPTDTVERYAALEVALERKRARKGQSVLRGKLKNVGKGIAYDITVDIVAYRDKEQTQALGVASAKIDGPLAPNETRTFETAPMLLKRRAQKLSPRARAYARPHRR